MAQPRQGALPSGGANKSQSRVVEVGGYSMRVATATAHGATFTPGGSFRQFRSREVELSIEAEFNDTETSTVVVKGRALGYSEGRLSERAFDIQQLQLGDLPLLVLALQEAIRIGVEEGAFPEVRVEQ